MQPPWRLSGRGGVPPHQLRGVTARRSLIVATRVCWRNTHTNEVYISGHFRVFRSACCARKSLSISAPRPFSASVPLPCDRRAPDGHSRRAPQTARPESPQTATGRRRAPQTATGRRRETARTPESAPDGHRTPESAPDGHRTPESAPRRPQDAGERPRRPQDAGERPRRPQDAGERPRRPQDAGERPRRPQDAGERPFLSKIVLTRLGGSGTPPQKSAPFLIKIQPRAVEGLEPPKPLFLYLGARARDFGRARFDWSHGADYMVTWDVTYWGRDETVRIVARRRDQELRAGTANEAAGGRRNLERLCQAGGTPQDAALFGNEPRRCLPPETEPFIMLQPAQNAAVVRWIAKHPSA